ncbi:MAG TPA: ZIP family metal transporter [Firmicutes bacterium]|nr:ZIP family metal transporter [Bacillota bacterium]
MTGTGMTVLGMSIIFVGTALGALTAFIFKKDSPKANTLFLGFAAGIMVAASIWSLLDPSLEQAEQSGVYGDFSWVPAAFGFIIGGLFLTFLDKVLPHIHTSGEEEGLQSNLAKPMKMFVAVTIHNIPEGLAVGVTYSVAAVSAAAGDATAFAGALGLSIGMAIQNFPEGASVALPMASALNSKWKAALFGVASGIVEPIAAVVGYFLATGVSALQPWMLAFAAGAMIFVVIEDLVPDAHFGEHPHLATWGTLAGFVIMMTLDVALG